ncbi:Protein ABHD1 [Portunus trituberculatus]|uniref:Protein ABHD1 n=1 Tax=Portunus trituberculatus TaxID=210409 RepID=A0A5B7CG14_PORTR|nr:Protein ABHD1 [Portunus trituberculatus]
MDWYSDWPRTLVGLTLGAGCLLYYLLDAAKSKTIREFDSRFTAVQFGFRDVEDYYRTACLHDKLHLVRVPLLCLSAADDPFQPLQGTE